ncbi:MAG TPA: ABC transporter ATP-binding protein, partial [Candidatus Cloacimonas acidaminovorans]|nr:ABC transporter ATP-binding protein [Candidatus Cloacimonas acidaminovorans]
LTPGSSFSLGDFTAFLFALFSMLHPLKVITQVYTDIRKALVSLDRIGLVLNQESRIQDKPDAITKETFDSEITFENVTFGYKENKPVLKNFSLTIPKGSKVAFVGASGGGKTTIANLMNRLYDVTYGAIKIDGIDIRDIKLDNLRKFFGVVTQDSILFSKSIKENIAYGSQEEVSDEQIIKAAQIANAEEFINEMPNKYDEVLGSKGSDLSGGQKQRLCIARAIVGDPPILIFDEATSALDTDSEQKVQMAIDKATQNRTVILIAHRLSTILKADKIVVLEKGKIVGMGTHQELMQNCPRYQHLYNLQQGK